MSLLVAKKLNAVRDAFVKEYGESGGGEVQFIM